MLKKLAFACTATIAIASATPSSAATVVLDATGSGWCNTDRLCNNTDVNTINNHFTGSDGSTNYNDFFAFNLPTGQMITSAVLSIWNSSSNAGGSAFNLFEAANFTFDGLSSGPVLGTLSAAQTRSATSQYVNVTLNNTGLARLNGTSGTFVFGGSMSNGEFAGYTGGTPVAQLTLQTAAVPEPATWAMMLVGVGVMGFAMRRRKKNVTTTVAYAA